MKQAEDELTAAAERIREIAKAATDPEGGPWLYDPDRAYLADAEATLAAVYDDDCGHHMALFDPSTALLVAEVLEGEAARWAPRPVDDLATYLMSPACKLARHITGRTT